MEFKEFKDKQYDGPYEVCGVDIYCDNDLFKGVLYYPPESFDKPYPLIIYFHGFPQLFTLQEIVQQYIYLLEIGYAFLIFNFRGYRYSQGKVSIKSQVNDALHVIEFAENMSKNAILDPNNLNIIAHDFGAYIALILCSKTELIKKLLLISPIVNLKHHVYHEGFKKMLYYINRFLPRTIRGVDNVEEFIAKTKDELSIEEFQIEHAISNLNLQKLRIIIGEKDDITPISEIYEIFGGANLKYEIEIISCMGHECAEDEEIEDIKYKVKNFFKR